MCAEREAHLPKSWTYLAWATWLALLIWACWSWRERALFMDASFQVFHMLLEERPLIYHYRFCNAFVQWLPLLAIKLKLPLAVVLWAYSFNVWLLYFAIWWILHYALDHQRLAWVWLLFLTLISLDSFYFIPPELFQGTGWLLVLWAWWQRRLRYNVRIFGLVAICLMAIVIFAHSLLLPLLLYCAVWFAIDDSQRQDRVTLGLVVLGTLALGGIHEWWFTDWYDAMKKEEFWRHARQYWPRYWAIPAHGKAWDKAVKFYYFWPILFGLMSAIYIGQRQWGKLLWMWGFSLGFLLLLHIGSPATAYRFYSEANYMPLSVVVALPFVFDGWDAFRQIAQRRPWQWVWPYGAWAFLALIVFVRLNAIVHNHDHFVRRLNWMVDQIGNARKELYTNRLLMPIRRAPMELIVMEWSVPYESVLATALIHPDSAGEVFIRKDFARFNKWISDTLQGWFLSEFDQLPADTLPRHYINLNNHPFRQWQ